jgi:hypothetical protein
MPVTAIAVEHWRMGILDLFGRNAEQRQPFASSRVKGPCATLRDHGIDPAELKFTLNEDGTVTVAGCVRDEFERERICKVIDALPFVAGVRNHIVVDEACSGSIVEALVNY